MSMTVSEYKSSIAANLSNAALNQVINDYANLAVERDTLAAKVADLQQKLNPTVEADKGPQET